MAVLVAGLILFLLPHCLREIGLRDGLAARFPSEGAWKGAYSVVSLLGLGLIVWSRSMAPFVMVWEPPFELRQVSHYIMLPVFWLILAGSGPVSWIRHKLRNPMLFGVILWGAAHLWANGDLASMLLFGSFTLWGIVKYCSLWRLVPAPRSNRRMLALDLVYALLGSVLYAVLFVFHGHLFGIGLALP